MRPWVLKVWLIGSRSPAHYKEPREESDWDVQVLHTGEGYIPNPRTRGIACCLTRVLEPTGDKEAVEIWPEDKYGILK